MTDFNKPYELRDLRFDLEIFNSPKCVFCHNSARRMVGVHITTAQEGIESSSADWICKDCLSKIYKLCKENEWIFNKND